MTRWTDFLDPEAPDGAYLPWKRVEARVGISRTTAWRLQRSGDFPKPYVVSPGRVAYKESEVEAWKASRGHRDDRMDERSPTSAPPSLSKTRTAEGSAGVSEGGQSPAPAPAAPASQIIREPAAPVAHASRKRGDSRQITFDF